MSMQETLIRILSTTAPSGREETTARVIRDELAGRPVMIRTDVLGNLIVTMEGTGDQPKKVMLNAHMDSIGFVVTAADSNGFLRVAKVGEIEADLSQSRPVVFENGVTGIMYGKSGGEKTIRNLVIDIGAKDKEDALKMVQQGDMAVTAGSPLRLGNGRLASPAISGKCGCAVLVQLLKEMEPMEDTLVCVFTAQEEVGCRGAKTAAFAEAPDLAVTVDVSPAADVPGEGGEGASLGKGVCIRLMDHRCISDVSLRDELTETAKAAGIPYKREILSEGVTDASAVQTSRNGVPVCTLGIPCRGVHTPWEIIDLQDMESCLALLKAWLNGKTN